MEGRQGILLALIIASFTIRHLVQGQQDQEGFISLDCGLPTKESPYVEPKSNLTFSSDAEFIQSGTSGRVAEAWLSESENKQYNYLRYFPDGRRNCYNLVVNQGTDYLLRAGFMYGNYDGRDTYPKFEMYIGPNLWTTVESVWEDYEIIHKPKSNSLQICLVKTGETTPMISTLEVRPLKNGIYNTQSGSLKLSYRSFCAASVGSGIRYPDDIYDRIWTDRMSSSEAKQITTTLTVNSSNPFEPPQSVLRTACMPINGSEPLDFFVYEEDSRKVFWYLHFAEIQVLQPNDTREFDILFEENIVNPAYSPKLLQLDTIYTKLPAEGFELRLRKTKRSTLPPLLSAIEVYMVMEFPYSETDPNDVAAIKNIQTAYGLNKPPYINLYISWQGDPCLPELYRWKGVECRYTNKSIPPRIISLDLSGNRLRGSIAPSIQNLTELQNLDLSRNNLSGGVPGFLAIMKSFKSINLSWNNLTGTVPQSLLDRKHNGLKLSMEENPELCQTDRCNNSNSSVLVPLVAATSSLVFIVAVLVLIFFAKRKTKLKVRRRSPITKSTILTKKRMFTYEEVEAMTNNFERTLGEGGFGVVYHGSLSYTEHVAVKLLSQSSTQGYKQFKAEVELLLRVHHTNLVNLVGYCNEDDHLALVYEYASKGDLKQHLSGELEVAALNWESRLRIATETAQGLEYLHTGCEPPMIHRDVKTSNILLDENYQAKLADFGLSRSFPVGLESHVSTNIAGTPGYLDPEYYRTNWLTEKSDVYSLGIVLLEMITSQPVIKQTREKPHIAEWVGLMLTKGDIESIMDPNLDGDYDSGSVWRALELAMSCVNPSSSGRPNMSQVVSDLKECLVYENSRKEGKSDMDSMSSVEVSITNFTPEMTPDAR